MRLLPTNNFSFFFFLQFEAHAKRRRFTVSGVGPACICWDIYRVQGRRLDHWVPHGTNGGRVQGTIYLSPPQIILLLLYCFNKAFFFSREFSNFQLPTSLFSLPTSNFRLPSFDFRLPTSNFQLPTSNFGLQTSDFRLQTFNFQLSTSNFRLQISNFQLPTSNFSLQTSHFRPRQYWPTLGTVGLSCERNVMWTECYIFL